MTAPKNIMLAVAFSTRFLIRTLLMKYDYELLDYPKDMGKIPDLVIFDKDAIEAARKFALKGIAQIMISEEVYVRLPESDFRKLRYIKEPFSEDQLVEAIQILLNEPVEDKIMKPEVTYADAAASRGSAVSSPADSNIVDSIENVSGTGKPKIIIADDDPDARRLANVLLGSEYNVIEVNDGKALVEKVSKDKPDLIISDIVMPGLSGWRATKKIRENPEMKDIPIIFYSSLLRDYDLYHTLKPSGPSVFMMKPYKTKDMIKTIKEMLNDQE